MKKNRLKKIPTPDAEGKKLKPANNPGTPPLSNPEVFFQNLFSSLIQGVLIVSRDLTVLNGNPAVEEIFRRSKDSFEGRPLAELFPEQPEITGKTATCIATGTSYHDLDCTVIRKSGTAPLPLSLTLSPYINAESRTEGAIILVKDMSLLKELQESSWQMDHLSTIGALALGMAHEIRNPLGSILASAQLLWKDLEDPEQREYLEVVISEVGRINRLVGQMMDFTRPRELRLRTINIHKILEEIIVLEQKSPAGKNIRFVSRYDPSLPQIEADEDQLKQVFLNLIKNAVEASPKDGEVRLVTRVRSAYGPKFSSSSTTRQNILVEIIDSGTGLDEEVQKNIFTPFFTTKFKGSGLGLPISLKIVENHRGKIKLFSENGVGTTAQVLLPVRGK
ncbi:MAG: ATP-binding protein [Nitrospinaceae bacterium]